MNMPVYVSPEQLMKDRADFARKGIARGRPVIVMQYQNGILFVSENPSRSLHKIAEIYDRIGFAAVGKYNEFEKLRVAGVRYADMRGFTYARADVSARGLANAYAQILGASFTSDPKPMEVELVVAEVGATSEQDQIYRLSYDGSVAEEPGYVVMGADAETLRAELRGQWGAELPLNDALALAYRTLGATAAAAEPAPTTGGRNISSTNLEVAVLERDRPGRKFRRLVGAALPSPATLLASGQSDPVLADPAPADPGQPDRGSAPEPEGGGS